MPGGQTSHSIVVFASLESTDRIPLARDFEAAATKSCTFGSDIERLKWQRITATLPRTARARRSPRRGKVGDAEVD